MCSARRAARRTGRAGGPPRTCEQKGRKTIGDIDLPVSVAVAAVVVASLSLSFVAAATVQVVVRGDPPAAGYPALGLGGTATWRRRRSGQTIKRRWAPGALPPARVTCALVLARPAQASRLTSQQLIFASSFYGRFTS